LQSGPPNLSTVEGFDVGLAGGYSPALRVRNYVWNLRKMANTKSAKKATRVIARRTAVNKARRTRMRSSWRTVEEAIASGDAKKAQEALRDAESATMKAAGNGVVHKNLASRKVSRLSKRIAALSGSPKR
jgi:small subunit ribosomal protein S20